MDDMSNVHNTSTARVRVIDRSHLSDNLYKYPGKSTVIHRLLINGSDNNCYANQKSSCCVQID